MKRFVLRSFLVALASLALSACLTIVDFSVFSPAYVSRHPAPASWRLTCNVNTGPSAVTATVEVTSTDPKTNMVTGRLGFGDLNAARREAIALAKARGDAFNGWFNLRCETEGGLGPRQASRVPPYLNYQPREGFYLTMQVYDGGRETPLANCTDPAQLCYSVGLHYNPPGGWQTRVDYDVTWPIPNGFVPLQR